ncbi:MAG: UDP-N-acetylmuramate--L-alanine ligase [Hydrogenoanaerobacterium sp.]
MTDSDEKILEGKKHIHFIGIGGSGMFPLVQILHGLGYNITGSDNNETDTVSYEREKMNIPVCIGQCAENINGADLLIYTAAVLKDNPELVAAKACGVPCLERAELLGIITKKYSNCICICGTHGKTTSSAMTTQIALEAGLDPAAFIGGKLPSIGGGGRMGGGDVMVCESCEFCDHYLMLSPDITVILNIDSDHLDYFGSLENIIASFHRFAMQTSKLLIVNGDDENTQKAIIGVDKPIITFGRAETNDYYPANIRYNKGIHTEFDLMHKGEKIEHIELKVPGRHNILNAVAACAAALSVGAKPECLHKALLSFGGVARRFEVLATVNGVTIVDDYAHHPTELEATLRTAKEMDFKRVWAVFQPFTFSRTALLLDDFARVLSIADKLVMSEIMGSREVNTYNIYTSDLAAKIPNSVWFKSFEEIADYVMKNATEGDLVITLGCGDINKCAHLMANYNNR